MHNQFHSAFSGLRAKLIVPSITTSCQGLKAVKQPQAIIQSPLWLWVWCSFSERFVLWQVQWDVKFPKSVTHSSVNRIFSKVLTIKRLLIVIVSSSCWFKSLPYRLLLPILFLHCWIISTTFNHDKQGMQCLRCSGFFWPQTLVEN